jgi:hypothetical protein
MQIAGSYGAPSRRKSKPLRRRLGRTWQDRAWRATLIGQLPPKALLVTASEQWRRDAERTGRDPVWRNG